MVVDVSKTNRRCRRRRTAKWILYSQPLGYNVKPRRKDIMRMCLSSLILFLSLFVAIPFSNVLAGNQLTEQQALDILVAQIQKDKLYDSWTTLSCLFFLTEEKTKDYFDFAIHEKHAGGCPGDSNTSPVVDRFRVNRLTKKIQWYEPTQGELRPYGAVLKAKRGKQE